MSITQSAAPSAPSRGFRTLTGRSSPSYTKFLDSLTVGSSVFGATVALLLIVVLTGVLVYGAWPAMQKYGWRFIIGTDWDPVELSFGALPVIYGSVITSLIALIVAVPISIGVAIVITRLAPRRLASAIAIFIDILAAIPSIGYGFWGVAVLVPLLQKTIVPFLKVTIGKLPLIGALFSGPSYGFSMLAGGLILAIMILPIVTAVARDVLAAVPRELEEGGYAMGATWWQATRLVLSYARGGILAAVILGLARAIGETMAVAMIIGNRNAIDASLLAPAQTMASVLANEFREADSTVYLSALVYVALILLVVTLLLNMGARLMIMRLDGGSRSRRSTPVAAVTPGASAPATPDREASRAEPLKPAHASSSPRPRRAIRHSNPWTRFFSKFMVGLCIFATVIAVVSMTFIVAYILLKGVAGFNVDFFTRLPGPIGSPMGMKNAIIGTLILIGLASLIGIPIGMLTGIYLAEYAKAGWFPRLVRVIVDVLAGTPSIIVGVLAYQLVVVPMGHFSGYAGSLALAFIMVPIVARATEEMLKLVPQTYREASLAVGGSKFSTLWQIVLPAARTGILTGVMLAIARVAGETAPLLFTALGNDSEVYDPGKPFPALTLKIFQYATSAEEQWISQAWTGMVVLTMLIIFLSLAVRLVAKRR